MKILPIIFLSLCLFACNNQASEDLTNNKLSKSQEEIKDVINSIVLDAESANIEGLQSIHLDSDKFTKFGPRNFNRQNVKETNISEAEFFSSILSYKQEVKDLKIDVFGNTAIATYYPKVSFIKDGETRNVSGRQTLVFLETDDGWKIVHEHGTPNTK